MDGLNGGRGVMVMATPQTEPEFTQVRHQAPNLG